MSLGQDASLTIMTSANYQQEKLKFGCSPTQQSEWGSVSHITFSKDISTAISQDIVTVKLQTNPTIQNSTTWFSGAGNWQSRAQIIKQYVQPVAGSGIEFDIPPEQVLGSDEGTYHCKVSGRNSASQNIDRTASGTLSFKVNPTSINEIQANPYQPGNIHDVGSSVTLTCSGTVGRPAGDLTWCYRRPNDMSFSGWPFTADINQEDPTPSGCQNFRTSTLTFDVYAGYEYYEFKCVTGSTSCNSFDGLSTNITIYRYTTPPEPQTTGVSLGPDASITIVSSASYQQQKLKFGCSPTQPTAWSSLSRVTLSKNTSATTTQDIVTVILQTYPTVQNTTTWFSGAGNWQSRAQIIKQYVQPVAGSGIEFDIPPEQVLCSDEGTYHCKVSGRNSASQNIDRTASGTLSFKVNPTSINEIQANPYQPGNIHNVGSSVTLTCSGTVGRPAGDLTWCYRKPNEISFSGWPFAADINQEAPTPSGCQNFRTSTLTYNVSDAYEYYQFKCVTGTTSCNSFDGLSANITIYRYTTPPEPQTTGVSLGPDASITIVSSASYQQQKLKFGCSPAQPSAWSSLSHVTLSKNTSATTSQDIVTVILQTNPTIQNSTTWFSGAGNWQSRAQIIKQYVQPVAGSGIEFDIPPEQVMCSDEGTYHCKVSGRNSASQNIDRTASGTLSFKVNPTSINEIQANPYQPGNIHNVGSSVTLTCSGTVGRPAGDLTWCYRRPNEIFSGWPIIADINQEAPTPSGCQNFRTSTLTYNVSDAYEYYQFKCVTGTTSCNSFDGLSANITIYRYTTPPEPQTTGVSFGPDASLSIVNSANYQQEKLKFGCSPAQPSAWSSLSHVTLSKNTSATTTQDIITVILQTNPTVQNKTTWFSAAGNWQSRAQIIKQYVQPVTGSGIEFDILPEQGLCSDEGTYHCKVSGQITTGQNIERAASGTLSFIVNPSSINDIQTSPYQPGNIYEAGTSVILTCSGTVGRPAGDLTWCYKRPDLMSYIGWPTTADINQETPIPNGCQNFRTSSLTYNVSAAYEYYKFKCVTGSTSCNSSEGLSANITIYRYTTPPETQTTDSGNPSSTSDTPVLEPQTTADSDVTSSSSINGVYLKILHTVCVTAVFTVLCFIF